MLDFAIRTAKEAGRILEDKFGKAIEITHKGDINIVTEVDLAAEKLIIERINSHFPKHAILSEEAGTVDVIQGQSEYKWIIDPLDGTTNYAHGYPCFAVSIALEFAGELIIGVVYDPLRDELFAAQRGSGATMNGRKIEVSAINRLNNSMICTGFPYNVREKQDFARHFASFIMHAQAVRRDGSAALDLAYVACGRFDGFWEEGLQPWDCAAGVVLIEEAGGKVSRYDGSPLDIYKAPIIVSNGLIHDEMLRVINL